MWFMQKWCVFNVIQPNYVENQIQIFKLFPVFPEEYKMAKLNNYS